MNSMYIEQPSVRTVRLLRPVYGAQAGDVIQVDGRKAARLIADGAAEPAETPGAKRTKVARTEQG